MVHFNGCVSYLVPLASKHITTLPVPAWLPYSLENRIIFALSYLHQSIGIFMSVSITVAMESLALTTMLQMCGQLEIIMHRINELPELAKKNYIKTDIYHREIEITKQCIKHHLYVYS